MNRLLIGIIILTIILWIHPVAGFLFAVVFSLFQSYKYYEVFVFGILLDIIYQSTIVIIGVDIPVYTVISLVVFPMITFLQKRMNFYV